MVAARSEDLLPPGRVATVLYLFVVATPVPVLMDIDWHLISQFLYVSTMSWSLIVALS